MDPLFRFCNFDSTYNSIGGLPIPGWCCHASYLSFLSNYILNMSISYRRSADTRELLSSNSFQSSCIGGPPIPGNYRHQIQFNHLVSAGCRYQETMGIKFIFIISYRRPADTRELWFSSSFTSSRIGGPPIPENYGNQIHFIHFVSAASRCQGTLLINFIFIISYRQPANTRELLSSISITSSRIGGLPIPMEFRDIVLVTYILSADCVSLSADPIFFGLIRHPLSADRSLLSAGCQ